MKKYFAFKIISVIMTICLMGQVMMPSVSIAQNVLDLPAPGAMVMPTAAFAPVMMKGIQIHPDDPLLFDFVMDTGKSGLKVDGAAFKDASQKLIKYFLAALTIKESDLWVNLSPYEKNRMSTEALGKTELGRDMLAQDYILKQLTASLIYPEKELGKAFWARVYAKAQEQFGTTDIPVDTFNKVWIVADKAKVLERNNAAYVIGAHLKVMLETDYLSTSNAPQVSTPAGQKVTNQIIREIIIPEIEKEVNQGQNFAPLRQMFYSMILATWYKLALKDALLNQVYSNKAKTSGVLSDDPAAKEKIYAQYLEAYKKGVFNYVKEEPDLVPHKYFSGGTIFGNLPELLERAKAATSQEMNDLKDGEMAMVSTRAEEKSESAMAHAHQHAPRVLIVNDDPGLIRVFSMLTEARLVGYQGTVVNFEDAAKLLKGPDGDKFVLVMTDTENKLGPLQGPDIAALANAKGVPVVATSANPHNKDKYPIGSKPVPQGQDASIKAFYVVSDAGSHLLKIVREYGKPSESAMLTPGGIDLNVRKMSLDISKDGKGVAMSFDPAMVAEFQKGNFTGVAGVILRIVPIQNPLGVSSF
ncbi:MAG: hypothetical protein HQL19_04035 [Candidatus Omnitrophica bacterium]|nr:hypothetical protein [Candidatus Omnitrophota bacterium]